MNETRDQRRLRILNILIADVKRAISETGEDEEFQHVLMKLSLDLQKKKRSLVTVEET